MRQYLLTTYVTGVCSVAVLYTLQGEQPNALLRDVVALCDPSQTVRDVVIIIDYCVYGGSLFDCSFLIAYVCGSLL